MISYFSYIYVCHIQEGSKKSDGSTLPVASGVGVIVGKDHMGTQHLCSLLVLYNVVVVVVIIIIIVVIIVVKRKRRKSTSISSLVDPRATTKTVSQSEIEMKTDETIRNIQYVQAPARVQENIYDVPENPTDTSENSSTPYNNPTYEEPIKVKKTSTSSLQSIMRRKESRYERLSSVEEPGDNP